MYVCMYVDQKDNQNDYAMFQVFWKINIGLLNSIGFLLFRRQMITQLSQSMIIFCVGLDINSIKRI